MSGVGRQTLYASRTGSGISLQRSQLSSCLISSIGKSGARSAGPMGCAVPGWSGGGSGDGRSAWMLYQCVGSSFSSSWNLRCVVALLATVTAMAASPLVVAILEPAEPTLRRQSPTTEPTDVVATYAQRIKDKTGTNRKSPSRPAATT